MLDLTGYTYVDSYKNTNSGTALSANTEYIVLPCNGQIYIRNGNSNSGQSIIASENSYQTRPLKFKTPASENWYINFGVLYKKS